MVVVTVVAVAKVLVWAAVVIDMVVVKVLVVGVSDDVEIIVVGVVVIVLKFALPVSCSIDVLSDVAVDLSMGTMADVSANAFAAVIIALDFPVSTPLEEFSR